MPSVLSLLRVPRHAHRQRVREHLRDHLDQHAAMVGGGIDGERINYHGARISWWVHTTRRASEVNCSRSELGSPKASTSPGRIPLPATSTVDATRKERRRGRPQHALQKRKGIEPQNRPLPRRRRQRCRHQMPRRPQSVEIPSHVWFHNRLARDCSHRFVEAVRHHEVRDHAVRHSPHSL